MVQAMSRDGLLRFFAQSLSSQRLFVRLSQLHVEL